MTTQTLISNNTFMQQRKVRFFFFFLVVVLTTGVATVNAADASHAVGRNGREDAINQEGHGHYYREQNPMKDVVTTSGIVLDTTNNKDTPQDGNMEFVTTLSSRSIADVLTDTVDDGAMSYDATTTSTTTSMRKSLRGARRRLPDSGFNFDGNWSPEEIGITSGLLTLILIVLVLYCCCGCSLCDILMLFCCWHFCCGDGEIFE